MSDPVLDALTRAGKEKLALDYDPFQGDETYVVELSDRFVTTRKPHRCVICWDDIPTGARVRARTERNNEERRIATFYFCEPCCEAMGASWVDGGEAIEERTSMGIDRAEASRAERERGAS